MRRSRDLEMKRRTRRPPISVGRTRKARANTLMRALVAAVGALFLLLALFGHQAQRSETLTKRPLPQAGLRVITR